MPCNYMVRVSENINMLDIEQCGVLEPSGYVKENENFLVLGLPVHLLDDYCGWLMSRQRRKLGAQVVTLNSEMVMQADVNPDLAKIIRRADLVIPDGSGIIFYLWLQGKNQLRCPGIELAESLLQKVDLLGESFPVFFYGGKPGIANKAAAFWQKKLPSLAIAGNECGYLTSNQEEELLNTLKKLQPQLILVGLGVPRQELWIAKHRHLCPHAIWMGVGGSFDIWAGVKSRAPLWMRENNLEWLYRFSKEPQRWQRMLALPRFALRALAVKFGLPVKVVK